MQVEGHKRGPTHFPDGKGTTGLLLVENQGREEQVDEKNSFL